MQDYYTPKGKQLTIHERRQMQRWKLEGRSNREIARLLGKAPQTIHNEIKRGLVRQQVRKGKFEAVYSAQHAQLVYQENRKRSVRPIRQRKQDREAIEHYMRQNYSPEMIVKAKGVQVPVSTIYYWIHHGKLSLGKEAMLYPRKAKQARKHASPYFKPAGKSIEQRPDSINQRLEAGHYEIDTVIMTRAKNKCLLTLTDRKTRHQLIRLIPDKSAQAVNEALTGILKDYTVNSITADNGTEFSRLSDVFPASDIYYAHPYASWERGTNENHNRLIRRWLPKGTKTTTPKEVAAIEHWINHYPKRLFNYKSPVEKLKLANFNLKFGLINIMQEFNLR
ncbi:IS30 family transposase [Streptococcus pyogenes]|uniref:IS30 family transposase n=1 Tax=Streptococcus pyogenes TaxID=1314 RepID=UPI00109D57AA|nr:IS30 family transposase [Streptococcus pyogenes]QCK31536.1 IS30 family transposase [Streptococcus pyogenes]VGR37032.1 transposase [Streptococcus pyogenes]VGZ96643.1 transposase [Streptococcus pyogenes]VHB74750.1 transposase [Streptococcus pyogenes]